MTEVMHEVHVFQEKRLPNRKRRCQRCVYDMFLMLADFLTVSAEIADSK